MIDMLLYVSVGLLLVLVCRKPARRFFGAGPAFTLWLLPLLLATLPYWPAVPATWAVTPTILVLPAARTLMAQASPSLSAMHWAVMLWASGALLCAIRLIVHYWRLMREAKPLPADMAQALPFDQVDIRRLRLHSNGPAVLWAPRSLLLLPPDFFDRFGRAEQRLVLRHELAHLRRGDTWWNLFAELALALLWFHPLAWLAMPRFRLDQELACDERVLRQWPQDETAYASTLLHSIGVHSAPAVIPWLAEPQLKERLTMIQRLRPGALRRRVGFIGLASLMLGSAIVARAAGSDHTNQNAEAELSYNATVRPQYPADAIKHHEQGTVILTALVGTDGKVDQIKVDPTTQASPALIKAASDAVAQWHFNPAMKNGRPVASYARVPVNFAMTKPPAEPPADLPPPPPPAPPVPPPPPPPLAPSHASPSL
ncbi:M56 family metallopeptidase [Rhodanobacter sp. BL-MT-08]